MILDVNLFGALIKDNINYNNSDSEIVKAFYELESFLENCRTDEVEIKAYDPQYYPYDDG